MRSYCPIPGADKYTMRGANFSTHGGKEGMRKAAQVQRRSRTKKVCARKHRAQKTNNMPTCPRGEDERSYHILHFCSLKFSTISRTVVKTSSLWPTKKRNAQLMRGVLEGNSAASPRGTAQSASPIPEVLSSAAEGDCLGYRKLRRHYLNKISGKIYVPYP